MLDMTTLTAILGGIGLFLLGMWLMTDGLKLAAGEALRTILQSWASTNLKGLLAGILITATVQSSSAVTVATVGFVNAGLLTLAQAVWVIFGTNIGTTMTGWLVAFVGIKIDVGALALPLIGIGMLLRLAAGDNVQRKGAGQALAGFGVFFLGINVLQSGFAGMAEQFTENGLEAGGPGSYLLFLFIGFILTLLTQSSSAAIAITLTATAGGAVPLSLAAAAVIGTNIGTTSTAFFAALNATPAARRVAAAHVIFNLATGAAALLFMPLLIAASIWTGALVGISDDVPATLAIFHTLFNCLGVMLIWPAAGWLIRFLSGLFVSPAEAIGRPRHLDANLLVVPAVALQGLLLEVQRMEETAYRLAEDRALQRQTKPQEDAARQEGVLALGQEIRSFIMQMNSGSLPADAVEALPDILRALQHLEELTLQSRALRQRPLRPGQDIITERFDESICLMQEVIEARSGSGEGGEKMLATLESRTENLYQQTKAELLHMAATGRLHVSLMEANLRYAQGIRQCTEFVIKTERRLAPWREAPDIGSEPEADCAAGGESGTRKAGTA